MEVAIFVNFKCANFGKLQNFKVYCHSQPVQCRVQKTYRICVPALCPGQRNCVHTMYILVLYTCTCVQTIRYVWYWTAATAILQHQSKNTGTDVYIVHTPYTSLYIHSVQTVSYFVEICTWHTLHISGIEVHQISCLKKIWFESANLKFWYFIKHTSYYLYSSIIRLHYGFIITTHAHK